MKSGYQAFTGDFTLTQNVTKGMKLNIFSLPPEAWLTPDVQVGLPPDWLIAVPDLSSDWLSG